MTTTHDHDPAAPRPLRLACLVSGRGRTVLNLAERIERDRLPLEIVLVAATRAGVSAIDAAAERGLPTLVIAHEGDGGRAGAEGDRPAQTGPRATATPGVPARRPPVRARIGASGARAAGAASPGDSAIHDALDRALESAKVDLICLCGYLRLFRVGPWAGRVVNIHPGPLPRFGGKGMYGSRVHRAVLDAGIDESRCCVHLVDDEYDRGAILAERCVPILPIDTVETLEARVRMAEHELLPETLARIARREIELPPPASGGPRSGLSSKS